MKRIHACLAPCAVTLLAVTTATGLIGCSAPQSPTSLAVWIVDAGRELSGDTAPLLENELYSASRGAVTVRAAQNETIGLQLGLRTNRPPAGPYDVRVTDLVGEPGRIEAARDVRLYRVHDVRIERFRSWYPEHAGRAATPCDVPDVLAPWDAPRGGGPIRLEDTRSRAVWIDVRIRADTPPGRYVGRIELVEAGWSSGARSATAAPAFSTELRLEVLPLAVPAERTFVAVARVDPRDLLAEHLNWPVELAEETRILPDVPGHRAAWRLAQNTMSLLHEHRLTPTLAASFPKYQMSGERTVEIDWEPYDAVVSGWIDGQAYDDGAPAAVWPLPLSVAYPDATRNGGFASPRYARLIAAYLTACREHFEARGWADRMLIAIAPAGPMTVDAVEQARRFAGIVKQSDAAIPLLWHLPAASLRTLGWYNAPAVDLPDTSIWCPAASLWQPDAMARERNLGKRTWFVPDCPPYSPSLAPEAPPADPRALAWQTFRYEADGLWLNGVANVGVIRRGSVVDTAGARTEAGIPLLYGGTRFGLADTPVPSVRLKRFRSGLVDIELLATLARDGKALLARRTAKQLVPWAFTDAADANLITTRGAGWSSDPFAYSLARQIVLDELLGGAASSAPLSSDAIPRLADWGRLIDEWGRARVRVRGTRLELTADRLSARVFTSLTNTGGMPLTGRWTLPHAPAGWRLATAASVNVPPESHTAMIHELEMTSLAYGPTGVVTVPMMLETEAGAYATAVRLAVAAAPLADRSPTIDGDLSDWISVPNNVATDFQLVRGGAGGRAPALATRASFCMDGQALYVAVQCALPRGESPQWRADNDIPVDGAIPWGQDLVEVILSPRDPLETGPGDLLMLQIKPNALVVARRGARTDPPMNPVEPWPCNPNVAVSVRSDAWTIEAAIPLSAFDAPSLRRRVWGVNVTRLDSRRGEYSSWSGARDHCYAPESLGNLVLQQP